MRIPFLSAAAGIVLAGCAFPIERFAERNRLDASVIETTAHRHLVLQREGDGPGLRLHVYIEGDGIPWEGGREPARDPTPRNPLALRLMVDDSADVAYLGRPCYFGLSGDTACQPTLWTHQRYSAEVVSSMVQATHSLVAAGDYGEVVLIGFSGGGTIARLMARSIPELVGLLTVNANLDIERWVAAHGYQPLTGSLNPVDDLRLPPHVVHVQAVGSRDRVVPATVTSSYVRRHDDLIVWPYPAFDHVCCWLDVWPAILARFDEQLQSSRTARAPH